MSEKEPQKPKAKILNKTRVYNGFFKLDEYTIEAGMHQGGTQVFKRLVFERGHAVAILAYDPKRDEVLLINELRAGPLAAGDDPYTDSLPAGMIDAGETPITAAVREVEEETNLALQNTIVIHEGAYASAGGSSERIALVYGTVDMTKAGGVHGKEVEGESIKTIVMTAQEFIDLAQNGKLKNMSSLAAAFWFAARRDDLRKQAGVTVSNDNTSFAKDMTKKPPGAAGP